MGMFDWYKPKERTCCPVCKEVLEEWQGKDGDNALFVWQEGDVHPIDQKVDEDCAISKEDYVKFKLPRSFLYTLTSVTVLFS